jgi:hypothetical protein
MNEEGMQKGTNDSIENGVEKQKKQSKQYFEQMVTHYLENNPLIPKAKKTDEFEIRFGSNPKLAKPVSKIDYDNVVKQLYACGFTVSNPDGLHILRIFNEYLNPQTGDKMMSNIRAEIVGTDLIQQYCKTNSIQKIIDLPSTVFNKLKFTRKTLATSKNGERIKPVDITDFNFRASYQFEEDFQTNHPIARNIISEWGNSQKIFRCMNRVRFSHSEYPIYVDLTIVKTSKTVHNKPIPYYTIQEAGVFNNPEKYEIELEVDNSRVSMGTKYNTPEALLHVLKKCIRIVLSGLQETKYPISYSERDDVLQEYMAVVHGEEYQKRRVTSKDFVGPSSYTLQLENILPKEESSRSTVGNIRNGYTVTDKADGERKLLFISKEGKIYMIDTNMNVIFTGANSKMKKIHNTIIDGEHIKYDKNGNFINLYAAFDIYYINKITVREFSFVSDHMEGNENKFRLNLLNTVIDNIKPTSLLEKQENVDKEQPRSSHFLIKCKEFYMANKTDSIFNACSKILSKVNDGLFEYNTDGLIFTPCEPGVGGMETGKSGPITKSTWDLSFKWKPPQYNTIDFLVSVKKDKTGKDEVHHIFQDGKNLQGVQEIIQFKILVLRCGFDERNKLHAFVNPFQDLIDDNVPKYGNPDNDSGYKPVAFQPTNPYDPNACFCNVILKQDGSNIFMMTEEGEYFEEDMIVEFKYEMTNKDGWKWVPLRVRYDKTSELRAGMKNYGNAYHVANSNWHSIHHPITDHMISTGENIPEESISEDVYYNRSNEQTSTQGLRDFHNLFVKKRLITGVCNRGDILIDYAVGKAGDLSKWISSGLSFVFGVDVSKDNIHNRIDGACARYLRTRHKNNDIPDALFVTGNSGVNIRNGKAFGTEKDNVIARAIFGNGPKDERALGKGVYKHYGAGQDGFNVSSCQFAFHYFFENKRVLQDFLKNLAECTKIQGYFIGTCYDGRTVFNMLKNKKKEESITIMSSGRKIFEISKMYDETGFPDDDMSVGYPINVFQESINQVFREYLVNFEYVTRIMEDYGFVLASKNDAQKKGLPDSTGMFSELFSSMETEVKQNKKRLDDYGQAYYMTPEEKRISFMNRYFIFKKVRNVNTDKIAKIIDMENKMVDKIEDKIMDELEKETNVEEKVKPIIKKIKKPKIVLQKFEEVSANPIPVTGEKTIIIQKPKLVIR